MILWHHGYSKWDLGRYYVVYLSIKWNLEVGMIKLYNKKQMTIFFKLITLRYYVRLYTNVFTGSTGPIIIALLYALYFLNSPKKFLNDMKDIL